MIGDASCLVGVGEGAFGGETLLRNEHSATAVSVRCSSSLMVLGWFCLFGLKEEDVKNMRWVMNVETDETGGVLSSDSTSLLGDSWYIRICSQSDRSHF
jgi:hypothetical protein